ncbi:hypothetical protein CgunFtcFv8_001013 [Champsocephalus gunnari]|uniref:Uncharacterized protein n=1 Tax=Champsocephalus gunnari TaxID=52237 RepID=A0AAN8HPP4_CHAGU|nr:hypothetical protein CgunFtcFv8_001013 [Champsocephalus gunnari]
MFPFLRIPLCTQSRDNRLSLQPGTEGERSRSQVQILRAKKGGTMRNTALLPRRKTIKVNFGLYGFGK